MSTPTLQQISAQCVIDIAEELIETNGSTTNLDIKNRCIENAPLFNWSQEYVSKTMNNAVDNQNIQGLEFSFNGTFRTYFVTQPVEMVSQTDIAKELMKSTGEVEVEFIKQDGSDRTLSGRYDSMDSLGYIMMATFEGLRRVDPRTITSLTVDGITYGVK